MKTLSIGLALLLVGCSDMNLVHYLDTVPLDSQGFYVTAIIDPCGDAPSIYDEVLLRLSDGTLIASMSDNANGDNTRFAVLPEGQNYRTTDGSNCYFSVDNQGNVYDDHY